MEFLKTLGGIYLLEFCELAVMIVAIWKCFGMKFTSKYSRYCIAIGIFLSIFPLVICNKWLEARSLFGMLVELAVVLLIFNDKIYKKFLFTIFIYIVISIIVGVLLGIISFIPGGGNVLELYDTLLFRIIFNLGMAALIWTIAVNKKSAKTLKIQWYYLILIMLTLICWMEIIVYAISIQSYGLMETEDYAFIIFALLGLGITIIILISLILLNTSRQHYKEQNMFKEQILEMQQVQYEKIIQNDTNTKKFKHDLRSHINTMYIIAEENKYDKLSEYIIQLSEKINMVSRTGICTGNETVDAIINQLYDKAQNNNIVINFEGSFPADSNISQIDLCTIFYNLILNAIEACEKIKGNENKNINIMIKVYAGSLNITIQNPIDENADIDIIHIKTSKADQVNHGFGLRNIEDAINKYDGNIKCEKEKNMFTVSIVLHSVNRIY